LVPGQLLNGIGCPCKAPIRVCYTDTVRRFALRRLRWPECIGALGALLVLGCSDHRLTMPPGPDRGVGGESGSGGSQGGAGDDVGGGGGVEAGSGAEGGGGAGGAVCQPTAARKPFGLDPDFAQSFPDLDIQDCGGSARTIADVRCGQRLTLISVAAGWCGPCKQETPFLQELSQKVASKDIHVAQIIFEEDTGAPARPSYCRTWVDSFELTFPVFLDPESNTTALIDGPIQALTPLNTVVDEKGKVLWAKTGVVPADMEQILLDLLEKTK